MNSSSKSKHATVYALILLSIATLVTCLIRFGGLYPDSEKYLTLVDFFRGVAAGTDLTAPFCYRPLLPFLAALLPIPPEISFSVLNTIFIIGLSWVIFFLVREFGFSILSSFFSSVLCSVSWVVAYYGPVVLVDAGAMLFLGLALLLTLKEESVYKIALLLGIGVLFKEIALIGVVAYLLYTKKREMKDILVAIIPVTTYLTVRLLTPSGNPDYMWVFHLENLTSFLIPTLKTFILTIGTFLLFVIISLWWKQANQNRFRTYYRWIISVGIPSAGIFGLGLFFAHFDARFVWPLYFAMLPMITAGINQILVFVKLEEKPLSEVI